MIEIMTNNTERLRNFLFLLVKFTCKFIDSFLFIILKEEELEFGFIMFNFYLICKFLIWYYKFYLKV